MSAQFTDSSVLNSGPSQKAVLLSAVQPTNRLTLGNYLGAIRNWVELQKDFDCIFFAVDLHAMTVRQDPKTLADQTYLALATYIASGIHPEEATLFVQSHVPEHTELAWIFNCFAYMGEFNRMTQFKDKSTKQGANASVGLFTYPALMAADILLYQTKLVPVGEDQKQHLEITRDIAVRMNKVYGEDLFVLPEVYHPKVGARIMSLQNPSAKMSKSDADAAATIFLLDDNDTILKKFKKAVTDSGTEIRYAEDAPGIKNLLDIQASVRGLHPDALVPTYVGKQYGHLKIETAHAVIATLEPLREKVLDLMKNRDYLDQILSRGAKKAQIRAQKTLTRVYDRLGFVKGRFS